MNDAFFKTAARTPGFGFAGAPLDRLSERREDAAFLAALRARPDARAVAFARDMPLLNRLDGGRLEPLFPLAAVVGLGGARIEALLGLSADGAPVFAALLPDSAVDEVADHSDGFLDRRQLVVPGRDDIALVDLRSLAVQGLVGADALAVLGQAKAILNWHARHGHCANCGAPTRLPVSPVIRTEAVLAATRGRSSNTFCMLGLATMNGVSLLSVAMPVPSLPAMSSDHEVPSYARFRPREPLNSISQRATNPMSRKCPG